MKYTYLPISHEQLFTQLSLRPVLQDIRVPPTKLWKPDLLLYNSASENFDSTYPTNMIVYESGVVNKIPPGIFRS